MQVPLPPYRPVEALEPFEYSFVFVAIVLVVIALAFEIVPNPPVAVLAAVLWVLTIECLRIQHALTFCVIPLFLFSAFFR